MRTTVRLDDQLLADAKRLAANSGRTLTSLLNEGLRSVLARHDTGASPEPLVLPTGGSGGLRPGVTMDKNATVRDVMDGEA